MARTLFLVGFGVVIFGTVAAFRLGWPIAEAGYGVVVVTSLVLAFRIGLFGDGRGGGAEALPTSAGPRRAGAP